MKKIFMIFFVFMLLSLFTNLVFAATFDTLDSKIVMAVPDKNSGSSGTGTDSWWIRDNPNTGTRYVLRIDGVEVPEKYYINHVITTRNSNGDPTKTEFYSGTNLMKNGTLVDNYWIKHDDIEFKNEVIDWYKGDVSNFSLSNEEVLKLIEAVRNLAILYNDTDWVDIINGIYKLDKKVEIEIRAEILVEARSPHIDDTWDYEFMTYNEIRKSALIKGAYTRQLRNIRIDRKLDLMACKLYEKDQKYAVINGKVNCSCNYIKYDENNRSYAACLLQNFKTISFVKGGTSGYRYLTYTYTNNKASERDKYGCFGQVSEESHPIFRSSGLGNIQIEAIMPNICSVKIGTSYYTPYISKYKNDLVGNAMKFKPYYDGETGEYKKDGNVNYPVYLPGKANPVVMPNFDKTNETAYIFEGWDYIVCSLNIDLIKAGVTEKYIDKTTNKEIEESIVIEKEGLKLGESFDYVATIKDISGYDYQNSEISNGSEYPENNELTVYGNIEIMHYYEKRTYRKIVIRYFDDENSKIIPYYPQTIDFINNSTWPENGNIADLYMITDPVGHWGLEYSGYFFSSVKINGKEYKSDDMPKDILIEKNLYIEFHYEKGRTIHLCYVAANYLNGEYNGASIIDSTEINDVKVGENVTVDRFNAPESLGDYTYAGFRTQSTLNFIDEKFLEKVFEKDTYTFRMLKHFSDVYCYFVYKKNVNASNVYIYGYYENGKYIETAREKTNWISVSIGNKSLDVEKTKKYGNDTYNYDKVDICIDSVHSSDSVFDIPENAKEILIEIYYSKSPPNPTYQSLNVVCLSGLKILADDTYGEINAGLYSVTIPKEIDGYEYDDKYTYIVDANTNKKGTILNYSFKNLSIDLEIETSKNAVLILVYEKAEEKPPVTSEIVTYPEIEEFKITKLESDKFWMNVLNDEMMGNGYMADNLPIGQKMPEGSSPYKYAIAKGSVFLFNLKTIGDFNYIEITPKVYRVSKDDGVVEEVVRQSISTSPLLMKMNTASRMTDVVEKEWQEGVDRGETDEYCTDANALIKIGETYDLLTLNKNTRLPIPGTENQYHWYGWYTLPISYETDDNYYYIVCFQIVGDSVDYGDINYQEQTRAADDPATTDIIETEKFDQWDEENGPSDLTSKIIDITLPNSQAATLEYKDGYYPIAIFDGGVSGYEVSGTH